MVKPQQWTFAVAFALVCVWALSYWSTGCSIYGQALSKLCFFQYSRCLTGPFRVKCASQSVSQWPYTLLFATQVQGDLFKLSTVNARSPMSKSTDNYPLLSILDFHLPRNVVWRHAYCRQGLYHCMLFHPRTHSCYSTNVYEHES